MDENWYDEGEGSEHLKRKIAESARENPLPNVFDLQAELAEIKAQLATAKQEYEGRGERIEQLQASLTEKGKEIERLKKALTAIAPPQIKGFVFTAEDSEDEVHKEKLLEWLNENAHRSYLILDGTFYALATDVAEQTLKEVSNG